MCGRYSLAPAEFSQLRLSFQVEAKFELSPRYNIAPTWSPGYEPPVVFETHEGGRQIALARWWMIPASWARPLAALPAAFNARAEELERKPFWSRSLESRRCLVPTTGWREFNGPRGQRRAFQFHYDHGLFAFAGLWDLWSSPQGEAVQSFSIVTVAANNMVSPVHDRMPLCVDPALYRLWLDPEVTGSTALAAVRAPVAPLSMYEADARGNDVRVEGPECIAPAPARQLGLFS
jgi:putative SOS response-associated peptidase YedK